MSHLDRVGVLVAVHELQPVVLRVDDDGVSDIVEGNPSWSVELTRLIAGLSEHAGLLLVDDDEDPVESAVDNGEFALAVAEVTTFRP